MLLVNIAGMGDFKKLSFSFVNFELNKLKNCIVFGNYYFFNSNYYFSY